MSTLKEKKKSKEKSQLTPMMMQYMDLKSSYQDHILFYQMGDFYEMFFDDAVRASPILGITLTKRGYQNGAEIPMCGIPISAINQYLPKLIKSGNKVAICEQSDKQIHQNKKTIVERKITRIITSGTITDENLLDAKTNNFLLSIYSSDEKIGLAWCDISTGETFYSNTTHDDLNNELSSINPKEIILPEDSFKNLSIKNQDFKVSEFLSKYYDRRLSQRYIKEMYNISQIAGFGHMEDEETSAMGGLLSYIEMTQMGKKVKLQNPKNITINNYMSIDTATKNSLELLKTNAGDYKGSLLDTIDYTQTAAGGRKIYQRLCKPSVSVPEINNRLNDIEYILKNKILRQNIRDLLKLFPDITRPLARASLGRCSPRDLGSIRLGLEITKNIFSVTQKDIKNKFTTRLKNQFEIIKNELKKNLFEQLDDALNVNLPNTIIDGDIFRVGFSSELDQLRSIKANTSKHILELQSKYIQDTSIKSLKIKYNNFLGYFIEFPSTNKKFLDELTQTKFIHRQTLKNQMRFTSEELNALQTNIIEASEKIYKIEDDLFDKIIKITLTYSDSIMKISDMISEIDVTLSLSELAEKNSYCKPLVDESRKFIIQQGRHPIVENSMDNQSLGKFISNDCYLDEKLNIQLITGPNMAGKSTYLRQNALIAILAQIGSFVPAKYAELGIIDKRFSRVGASDDLAGGRSTFMVEMVETSIILNQATSKSFVIIDEIGRGTATFDGLAIAWATLDFLAKNNNCRTIFATHFHELTKLTEELRNIKNMAMQISEDNGEIIFLHEIKEGVVDKSYGIQVAKLAGLPNEVTKKAEVILKTLESEEGFSNKDLPLFKNDYQEIQDIELMKIKEKIGNININKITPIDALNLLNNIKSLIEKKNK